MIVDEAPSPAFAEELLSRLERDRHAPAVPPVLVGALAGAAATASIALIVAGRRRTR